MRLFIKILFYFNDLILILMKLKTALTLDFLNHATVNLKKYPFEYLFYTYTSTCEIA